jgi:DNA-directed RNA polymerase specialized sigma24 family protein
LCRSTTSPTRLRRIRYCQACRARTRGVPRPALHEYHRVSVERFLEVYEGWYRPAVRAAARAGNPSDAEDAAMDALAYLWRRRTTLRSLPWGLLLLAAKHRALMQRRSGWHRYREPVEDFAALQASR